MKNTRYTCIVVDDEALAQDLVLAHLKRIDRLEVLHTFHDPKAALAYANTNAVDVILLDIEMPNLNGLDFIRQLQKEPKVILTTAYAEFALDGYALNVIDYLLKPVVFNRFEQAVNKTIDLLDLEQQAQTSPFHIEQQFITVSSSHQKIRLDLKKVLYVEGLHKYIRLITADNRFTTLHGLTAFERKLPSSFFRCHRSYIINLSLVERIEGLTAFIGQNEIPISKTKKQEFMSLWENR